MTRATGVVAPTGGNATSEATGGLEIALRPIVDEICTAGTESGRPAKGGKVVLPCRDSVVEVVELVRSVLFPGYFGRPNLHNESLHYYVGATLDRVLRTLEEQIRRAIAFSASGLESEGHGSEIARGTTRSFLLRLPALRRLVASDVEAAFEGDPALDQPR